MYNSQLQLDPQSVW